MRSALRTQFTTNQVQIRFNHCTLIPHAADLGGSARRSPVFHATVLLSKWLTIDLNATSSRPSATANLSEIVRRSTIYETVKFGRQQVIDLIDYLQTDRPQTRMQPRGANRPKSH
jgi:hypothetical protein